MIFGLIPVDIPTFLGYTRYGTFYNLRTYATDCVFLLNGLKNVDVLHYILYMMVHDPDPAYKYHLVTSFSKLVRLKSMNNSLMRYRDSEDLWSYIDPEFLASEALGNHIWALLT
jgi:hypothetical protein